MPTTENTINFILERHLTQQGAKLAVNPTWNPTELQEATGGWILYLRGPGSPV